MFKKIHYSVIVTTSDTRFPFPYSTEQSQSRPSFSFRFFFTKYGPDFLPSFWDLAKKIKSGEEKLEFRIE